MSAQKYIFRSPICALANARAVALTLGRLPASRAHTREDGRLPLTVGRLPASRAHTREHGRLPASRAHTREAPAHSREHGSLPAGFCHSACAKTLAFAREVAAPEWLFVRAGRFFAITCARFYFSRTCLLLALMFTSRTRVYFSRYRCLGAILVLLRLAPHVYLSYYHHRCQAYTRRRRLAPRGPAAAPTFAAPPSSSSVSYSPSVSSSDS